MYDEYTDATVVLKTNGNRRVKLAIDGEEVEFETRNRHERRKIEDAFGGD